MDSHEMGIFLKKRRKSRQIDKRALSEMTGFTERAISYWESGERNITYQNLQILLNALGMDVVLVEKATGR